MTFALARSLCIIKVGKILDVYLLFMCIVNANVHGREFVT